VVRVANQRRHIQDYYIKDLAESSTQHLSVERVGAWYRRASSLLRDREFLDARAAAEPVKLQGMDKKHERRCGRRL